MLIELDKFSYKTSQNAQKSKNATKIVKYIIKIENFTKYMKKLNVLRLIM